MTKKTYLKGVTFDFEPSDTSPLGPHISYTTAAVGGAASGLNKPILLKGETVNKPFNKAEIELLKAAKEIRIEMSMEDFLQKFMGMYWDDAAILAKLLGFESSMETKEETESWLDKRLKAFTVIKSLETPENFFKLASNVQLDVLADQELFEKGLKENSEKVLKALIGSKGKLTSGEDNKEADNLTGKSVSVEGTDNIDKGVKMSDTNAEEVNKALAGQLADLQKQLATFQEREDKRREEQFITKAKSYAFIGEEVATSFGKILKSLSEADALTVLEVVEKAAKAIETAQSPMFERVSERGEQDSSVIKGHKAATRAALDNLLNTTKGE